jgi:hypothetical protein
VTSSPPIDQEVPTDSHLTSFGFSLDPPSGFALAGALVEASPNPLGFRMRSPWDRLTDISTYGPYGSEEDDEPGFCWDFSGLGNSSAMQDFMTECDYCLSDCSDGSRSLGDEGCSPSRECFHVDLGGPSEGNHLGMPEDGDLPRPVPRVDIPRELAVVPVQAGGHDPQLEQIRGVQARLDEGAGALEPIRRDVGQAWAGQPPTGEIRHLPQGFQHRIADDVRVRPPPASSGVGQNLAAAAMLLRAMPEPSTTEGRRIQGELKNLLEGAVVRRSESFASRRQGYPSEHHAATSRFMREASVYTGRTRNTAPAAPGRLGNEHHHRDRRAHLDERVRRGYHPRRGGHYDSEEDRSPSPSRVHQRGIPSRMAYQPCACEKERGKWRMCVDYTGLNKACPKVPYPMPRIDQIVDSTAGCETLSFLDAYSGYHQIRMKESDQLATSFITPFDMYCYVTMPFGLRNAGATYQRCMNHVFGEHIGRTVEAYVDDIVVRTRKACDLLSDLVKGKCALGHF